VSGVARKKKPAALHRLNDKASHSRDAFLKHRPFSEFPTGDCEPFMKFAPDPLIPPSGDFLFRRALDVEP